MPVTSLAHQSSITSAHTVARREFVSVMIPPDAKTRGKTMLPSNSEPTEPTAPVEISTDPKSQVRSVRRIASVVKLPSLPQPLINHLVDRGSHAGDPYVIGLNEADLASVQNDQGQSTFVLESLVEVLLEDLRSRGAACLLVCPCPKPSPRNPAPHLNLGATSKIDCARIQLKSRSAASPQEYSTKGPDPARVRRQKHAGKWKTNNDIVSYRVIGDISRA